MNKNGQFSNLKTELWFSVLQKNFQKQIRYSES